MHPRERGRKKTTKTKLHQRTSNFSVTAAVDENFKINLTKKVFLRDVTRRIMRKILDKR